MVHYTPTYSKLKCSEIDVCAKSILASSKCTTPIDDQRDILFCTMTETDQEYADLE